MQLVIEAANDFAIILRFGQSHKFVFGSKCMGINVWIGKELWEARCDSQKNEKFNF